ncbi:MAG: hypothetical protein ACFCGT_18150 [Sandaracinaceae bacterium]
MPLVGYGATDAGVLTNLLRPWILSRLLAGAAVAVLAAVAVVVAYRVLSHWRVGATSEGQLALERRAELVASVVQVAAVVAVLDLVMTVLAADRLTASIRGAMCAWGVFDASPWGLWALGVSALAAAACGFWVVLHRLDLRLRRPSLTWRKFLGLFAVAPLLWLDLGVTSAFFLDLDLTVVATCCSVGVDDLARASTGAAASAPTTWALAALGAALGATAASLLAARRPGPGAAWSAAGLSALAAAVALPAIVGFVAPHAYGTPIHRCPFCLLRPEEAGGLGWPLFAALFTAALAGTALGLVEAQRRQSGAPAEVSAVEQRLGAVSAVAWVAAILLAAAPVVRYAWVTGGAPLFGV